MSETCGYGTCNPPDRIKIGTVGPPAPGVEIKLAEDGEILVKGGFVMRGYRNLDDKTKETLDRRRLADDRRHRGDRRGRLRQDRRPQEGAHHQRRRQEHVAGEHRVRAQERGPADRQAAVIGDARSYNTALIVLDADGAPGWAQKNGIDDTSLEALAGDDKVREAVQAEVDKANEKLSRVEQVKKFHIVEGDWEPGGDELTPTMKLKRKPIAEKYESEIEALYEK
jgi:long-subunit acyl-CoA synthetase (AMP-forming)